MVEAALFFLIQQGDLVKANPSAGYNGCANL
jgi:hypothetical protein